jgi:hypothetical protein
MSCEIQISETKGSLGAVTGDELTVGRPFVLKCDGDWPELNVEKLELRLEEADKQKLKLLKFEKRSGSEAYLLVTSYQVGNHQLKAVQLVDSEHSVVLGDLQFSVQSVIDPAAPPKEPYGPMGPIVFGIPLWFWLTLSIVLTLVVSLIWWRGARRARRKKWLLEMKLYEKVLSPMAELGKSLRHLQKDLTAGPDLVKNLDLSYRVYLARMFKSPTLYLSDRQILKDIQSSSEGLYDEQSEVILKTLEELNRAGKAKSDITQRDLEQLIQMVRRGAEDIDRYLNQRNGGRG